MADTDVLNPASSLNLVGDFISRVGFPVFMVLILSYVIYQQNTTLIKVNAQQAANMTAFTTRMDHLEQAIGTIREAVRDNCAPREPGPAKP